jgi:hypothetical protein
MHITRGLNQSTNTNLCIAPALHRYTSSPTSATVQCLQYGYKALLYKSLLNTHTHTHTQPAVPYRV